MAKAVFTAEDEAAIRACRARFLSWPKVGKAMKRCPRAIRRHAVDVMGLPLAVFNPQVLAARAVRWRKNMMPARRAKDVW